MILGAVASSHRASAVTVGAVAFSNTGYYLTDGSTLAATDMTWAGWFKASSVSGGYHSFLSISTGGSDYWISSVNSSGVLVQDNSPTGEYSTGHTVTPGVWHYVAVAHHESSGAMEFYYAIESDPALTKVSFTGSTGPAASAAFQIGTDFFAALFKGAAAQVKVWTAALSEAELTTEWQKNGVARTSGLWGYWSFGSGPQTTDESGGGHTLTVMNPGDPLTTTTGPTITG